MYATTNFRFESQLVDDVGNVIDVLASNEEDGEDALWDRLGRDGSQVVNYSYGQPTTVAEIAPDGSVIHYPIGGDFPAPR